MDAALEMEVARLLHVAAVLERALHGTHTWTMACGDLVVPAELKVTSSNVTFTGDFAPHCFLVRPDTLSLLCDGEVVSVRPVDVGDNGFSIEWSFRPLITAA